MNCTPIVGLCLSIGVQFTRRGPFALVGYVSGKDLQWRCCPQNNSRTAEILQKSHSWEINV